MRTLLEGNVRGGRGSAHGLLLVLQLLGGRFDGHTESELGLLLGETSVRIMQFIGVTNREVVDISSKGHHDGRRHALLQDAA